MGLFGQMRYELAHWQSVMVVLEATQNSTVLVFAHQCRGQPQETCLVVRVRYAFKPRTQALVVLGVLAFA